MADRVARLGQNYEIAASGKTTAIFVVDPGAMIALPPLAQGTTFANEYQVVELLAHTNQVALYGALHQPSGEMRALQLLFTPVVPGVAFRERFARAAMDANRAAGGVVPLVEAAGVDATANVPYVVTEPFRGELLASALRGAGMPVAEVMDLLGQVSAGLGQLHSAGIVHGALRPEAVVLIPGPTMVPGVKLLNAGLAKILGDARVALSPSSTPCDPSWASPEQIDGGEASVAGDVYSFALLAFAMLTGQRLFRGNADAAIAREATKDPLPVPTTRAYELGRGGSLPQTFDAWFARAAARNPAERHASIQEAYVDLQAAFHRAAMAYTGSLGAMTSAHLVVPPAPRSSGRGAIVAATVAIAAVLGVSALGGIGYFAVQRFRERAQALAEQARPVETRTSAAEVAAPGAAPSGDPGAAPSAAPNADAPAAATEPSGVPSIDIGALPSHRRRHGDETKPNAAAPAESKPVETAKTDSKPAAEVKSTSGASDPSTASPASLVDSKPGAGGGVTRLQVVDLSPGKGKAVKSGDKITVRYTGKRQADGVVYDTSHATSPFSFTLGQGRVTKGWEQGIPGMKVGGKRRLTVPPSLAYGEKGLGANIPPNATLIFDIELVGAE